MELTAHRTEDQVVLKIAGRLDSYWSSHFANELDRLIREGNDTISLDFTDLDFLSSAGIGVIMRYYNAVSAMNGTLRIVNPQPLVRSVLTMTGLERYLVDDGAGPPLPGGPQSTVAAFTAFEYAGRRFSYKQLNTDGGMELRVFGDPSKLPGARFTQSDTEPVSYDRSGLGVGLGAFGATFTECAGRFGEYLSLGGCTAFMPSDDTNTPDYLIEERDFTPSVLGLYGIHCSGEYTHFVRFELPADGNPIEFPALLEAAFRLTGFESLGLGMVAETSGLIGATLKRSPAQNQNGPGIFSFPEIRRWISFTAEPAHAQTLAVVAGIATRRGTEGYVPFLRQSEQGAPYEHFHAMACAMQPLGIGVLDIHETVCGLIRHSPPLDVMHLLNDTRHVVGSGSSEFLRGVMWIAPIVGVAT